MSLGCVCQNDGDDDVEHQNYSQGNKWFTFFLPTCLAVNERYDEPKGGPKRNKEVDDEFTADGENR